jgi:hypothetical protein
MNPAKNTGVAQCKEQVLCARIPLKIESTFQKRNLYDCEIEMRPSWLQLCTRTRKKILQCSLCRCKEAHRAKLPMPPPRVPGRRTENVTEPFPLSSRKGCDGSCSRKAKPHDRHNRLLSNEVPGGQQSDRGFLTGLGHHSEFCAALLKKEYGVSGTPLRKESLEPRRDPSVYQNRIRATKCEQN